MAENRKWCFEAMPDYHGASHICHKKAAHSGPHLANMCGAGHRGGRKAKWTCADDLEITGKGIGSECLICENARAKSDHPQVRVISQSA